MPGMVEIAPLPPVPLHDLFTYRVPEGLAGRVLPGMRVRVPLGRQTRTGVVTGFAEAAPPGELRAVLDVLEPTPFVPADLLELCRWTARYYLVSLTDVIEHVDPTRMPPPTAQRATRRRRRSRSLPHAARASAPACSGRSARRASPRRSASIPSPRRSSPPRPRHRRP